MVSLPSKPDGICPDTFVGPLLDDGTHYSGIGSTEIKMLQAVLFLSWNDGLDPIPAHIADGPHWQ